MKRVLFLLAIVAIGMISCNNNSVSDSKVITTSILPFRYFVRAIAGEQFTVNVIVPPGASPATFEPSPSTIKDLDKSEVLILDGYLGYELAWSSRLMSVNKNIRTLILADNQQLIESDEHDHGDHHHESGIDPHFWVSPVSARIIAKDILTCLSETYPDQKEAFEQNYANLLAEINRTDRYVDSVLTGIPGRTFMIFHPSLGYLARDYNLNQISVENEGKEPSPGDLKKLIDKARTDEISVIFVQREFDKKNAGTIASEINGQVVEVDPLAEDWPVAIITIANALAKGAN